ncbi:hypothetical protein [Anaerosporobacter sp.]|uniref:hypothetical protein n=1 Tax=Anaerosporobacter sp. TaxID=1872529 RepID=UPI00286F938B|nr:hypothetical protein [Anaerosporobacter sp.]
MKDYVEVFKKNIEQNNDSMIEEAMKCLNEFAEYFEHEDLAGMDSCCHFPHYLLSGNEVVCWETAGALPKDFFETLKQSGFKRTVVTKREPILVSENKVHFLYSYYRENVSGEIMSRHDNVWIVTYKNGKWGIQVRSY